MSNYLDDFRDPSFIGKLKEDHSEYVREIQNMGSSSHKSIETLLEGRFDFELYDELESPRFKKLQDYLSKKLITMVEAFIESATHNLYATQEIKDVLRSVLPELKLFIIDYDVVNACTFRNTTKIFVFSALIDKYFSVTRTINPRHVNDMFGKVSVETLLFDICHELGHIVYGRLNHSQKIVMTDRFYEEHFCDAFSFTLLDACGFNLSCVDLDSLQTKTYISNMFDFSSSHPSDCDRASFLRNLVKSDFRSYDDSQDSSEYIYEKDYDQVYNHADKVTNHSQLLHFTLIDIFSKLKLSPYYDYNYEKAKKFFDDVIFKIDKLKFITSSIDYDSLSQDVIDFFDRFYAESKKDNLLFFRIVRDSSKKSFTLNLLALLLVHGNDWDELDSEVSFPFVVDTAGLSESQNLLFEAYFGFLDPISQKKSWAFDNRKKPSASQTVSMVRYFNSLSLSEYLGLNGYHPGRPAVLIPSFPPELDFTELPLDEYLKFFYRLILTQSDRLDTILFNKDYLDVFDESTLDALFTIVFSQDTIRLLGLNDEILVNLFQKFHSQQEIDNQFLYNFLLKDANLSQGQSMLFDFYEVVCQLGYYQKFEEMGYNPENSVVMKKLEMALEMLDPENESDFDRLISLVESDEEDELEDFEISSREDLFSALIKNQYSFEICDEGILDYFSIESSKSDFNFVFEIVDELPNSSYIELYCMLLDVCSQEEFRVLRKLMFELRNKEGFCFDDYCVLNDLNEIFLALEIKKTEFIQDESINRFGSLPSLFKSSSLELYKFIMENITVFVNDFDLEQQDKELLASCLESLVSSQCRDITTKDSASLNGFEKGYAFPAFTINKQKNALENNELASEIISKLDQIFLNNITAENFQNLFLLTLLFSKVVSETSLIYSFSFKVLALFIEKQFCLHLDTFVDNKSISTVFNCINLTDVAYYMHNLSSSRPAMNKYATPVNELFKSKEYFSRQDHVDYLMYILPVQRFLKENHELTVDKIWSTDFPNWIKETLIYKHCNVSSFEDLNCVPREDISSKLKAFIKAAEYEESILKIDNFDDALNLLKETFKYPTKHRDSRILDLVARFSLDLNEVKSLRDLFTDSNTNFDFGESVLNSTLGHYLDAMNSPKKYKAFMALFNKPIEEKGNSFLLKRKLKSDQWLFQQDFSLDKFTIHAFNLRHNEEFIDWYISKLVNSGRPLLDGGNTSVIVAKLVSEVECDLDLEFEDFIIRVSQLILTNSHPSTAAEILSRLTKKILSGNCSIEDVILIFLEGFGVSGIKLAQVLSSQNNFDPKYDKILKTLSSLKENVSSINLNEFISTMEREFEYADRIQSVKLLNSGSIGSVWEVEIDGEIKILKLKKPNVGKFNNLEKTTFELIVQDLKRFYPDSDYGFDRLTEQVFDGIAKEADFNHEVENLSKLSQAGSDLEIGFPVVDKTLSNQNMIFMSKVPGVSLESLECIPDDLKSKLLISVVMMAVQSNVLHGDLHAGNVFVDLDSDQVSIIDCGLVVEIETDTKLLFMGLFNDLESSARDILQYNSNLSSQEIESFIGELEEKDSIGDKLIGLQSFLEKNNIIISSNFDQVLLALIKMSYLIS